MPMAKGESMKIVPLGTSSGQPTAERGVTGLAAFVGSDKRWVLVDCGEGTQQRIMAAKNAPSPGAAALPWGELGAILITHGHGDHCFGLFGILAMLSMQGRSKPLMLVCPPEVEAMAKAVLSGSHTHIGYPIQWTHPKDGLEIDLGDGLTCRCAQMAHRAPSHGYLLQSSKIIAKAEVKDFEAAGFEPGPELGAAIAAAKRGQPSVLPGAAGVVDLTGSVVFQRQIESLFVGGDNMEPERVAKAAPGALAWIHEATYLHEDWAKDGAGAKWGHSSARMVGEAAQQGQPGALVLTHFSPRYGEGPMGVERLRVEAAKCFDGPVMLAHDLAPIEFEPRLEPWSGPKGPSGPRHGGKNPKV
jgi:ribonuclease Z